MPFPLAGLLIGGGASVLSGILGGNAAENAADTAAAASRAASDAQMRMYEQTRADLQPQREAQRYALDALLSMTGLPGLRGEPAKAAPTAPARMGLDFRTGNPAFSRMGGGRPRFSGTGLDSMGRTDEAGSALQGLEFENIPSLADILAYDQPQARAYGGPVQQGRRYHVSEMGHPEGRFDAEGNLQDISTTPQTITAPQDGFIAPLGPVPAQYGAPPTTPQPHTIGLPGIASRPPQTMGAAIAGSSVRENPGGQEGRYNFMTDPGYGFRFDEGLRAIGRSGSARGMGLSGGILRELARYGQGLGSAEYGNVYNRISNIAGLGQTGQSLTAQAGMNSANQQSGYLQNIGEAGAAGTLGRASAYSGTIDQLARLYGQYGGGDGGTSYGYSAGGSITP